MDKTQVNLIELPTEIQEHIFSYFIPSGKAFRIKSLLPMGFQAEADWVSVAGFGGSGPETAFYCWDKKAWETWDRKECWTCPLVFPLLVTHPAIYRIIVRKVYALNTLWFPDPHTFQEYATARFSPLVRNTIVSLRVDACGFARVSRGCTNCAFTFKHDADLGVAETIQRFQGLRRLTLGGVGPGLVGSIEWNDQETEMIGSPQGSNHNAERAHMPLAAVRERDDEDAELWRLDCIALVARIIGAGPEEDGRNSRDDEETISSDFHLPKDRGGGPLQKGTVTCADVPKKGSPIYLDWGYGTYGVHRRMATHILAAGEPVDIGPGEAKVDVLEALIRARLENERIVLWKKAQNASSTKPKKVRRWYHRRPFARSSAT